MSEIAKILRLAVEREGVLPFAEFMRLALYCPKYGYYERPEGRIGRKGDFFTSVSTGPVFGELLARQLADWLETLPAPPFQLVEAGAHDGRLAADILGWLRRERTDLLASVQYWIVEPSQHRKTLQEGTLEQFADRVRWFDSREACFRPGTITGVIFSNELLDSFPVRRIGWDASAGRWFEWGVGELRVERREGPSVLNSDESSEREADAGPRFMWKRIPRERGFFRTDLREAGLDLPAELLAVLPDGYTVDLSPEAGSWWRTAALALKAGKLLTFDYGLEARQLLTPERTGGTLRAYHRHHATTDLLARAGNQDLTAHVNFNQLQIAGEEAGLETEALVSQEQFLTRIAARAWKDAANSDSWPPERLHQFRTLTHPDHLGKPFSVLLQKRG